MAHDVLLHIGLMKSGTTFLQGRMGANVEVLADQGILFPTPWSNQVQGVVDLAEGEGAVPGSWDALAEQVREHSGPAVLSMEFFGPLGAPRIERLRESLGGRVRAVATIRDLGRTVPAMWQESVQNRGIVPFGEYVEGIRSGQGVGRTFWRQQGAGRIVERWAQALGPENVTVITIPPPGAHPELLWERFREVAGIADAEWADAPRANESLGASSALLMRRLNERVADLGRGGYTRRIKRKFSKSVLPARKREEESIGFEVPGWLARRSEARTKKIAATGVRIVGDLAELAPLDVPGVDPDTVGAEEQLTAAVDAIARVLTGQQRG